MLKLKGEIYHYMKTLKREEKGNEKIFYEVAHEATKDSLDKTAYSPIQVILMQTALDCWGGGRNF